MTFPVACALAALLIAGEPAAAQSEPWKVKGKLIGEPKALDPFDAKTSEDVSGIACDRPGGFPRVCLLADDETQGVQIVVLKDGELIAGEFIRLISTVHDDDLIELDAEAVAYDGGSFYVMGSHGRARHEDSARKEAKNKVKAAASRHVFRIRFKPEDVDLATAKLVGALEIKPSTELTKLITGQSKPERDADFAASFDRALADNGLTIEGLAVKGATLYAGMRGPVLKAGAAILAVPTATLFEGQPGEATLHTVALGADTVGKTRGIRDLVPFENGFLIIAGPVNDPDDGAVKAGDYAIYAWDGDKAASKQHDLASFGKKVKPEALVPLTRNGNMLRALLLFDGPDEGEPRPIEFTLR